MKFSRAEDGVRLAVSVGLVLFLISPYLIWIAFGPAWEWPITASLGRVARRALTQAALSTVGAAVGGWILFRGLRARAPETRGRLELVLLLPNAVPPVFVALALIGLVPRGWSFPFGLAAVVGAHALLNAGLVAVALARIERARLGQMAEAAWAMGVSEFEFWTRVAWPLVRRDVITLLFFTFTICVTSFSIPLLLQGTREVSIEVAIYDLIRRGGRWPRAVTLAALQTGTLLLISALLPKAAALPRAGAPRALPYRSRAPLAALGWIPLGVIALGLARGAGRAGWTADPHLAEAWITTALIGAGVGAGHLVLFVLTAFAKPNLNLDRFLRGYLPPGPALTAFAAWLSWSNPDGLGLVIGALTLIGFAPLYRWQVAATLADLTGQWTVARTLGAGRLRILREITWPQAAGAILNSCGLAAIWACGDFAVSGLLMNRPLTLPVLIFERMAHYEWPGAYALVPPLALTATAVFSVYHVLGRYVRG